MKKDIDRIVAKVKKLLAMADAEGGASENERMMAMRQATALMDKHALDIDTVENDLSDPRGMTATDTGQGLWIPSVFSAIGRLYGCVVYCQRTGRTKKETVVTGKESARITVITLATWVCASINNEAKARGMKKADSSLDSFRKGATVGVHQTVDELIAARERGETVGSASKALVVVGKYANELALNQQFLDDQVGELKKGKSLRARNHGALSQGKDYGRSINLSRQVSGKGQKRING